VFRRFAHDELFDTRAGCAELVVRRVKRHGAALDEHGHLRRCLTVMNRRSSGLMPARIIRMMMVAAIEAV
jgi:hypothetical protein